MSALVTAAAGAALIPDHVQKERLKKRIIAAAGGDVADWVAGSAANLEVYHGVPMADIDRVLCDLQAMREAGNLRSAGRFLHAKFRELAARHGKPWPRRVARSTKA
ncbi:MAG: hypothetical protein HQ582_24580 [Planctomycetes bacterium]|nr:hypothetical protein [Planctomycetota bacterium]